MSKRKGQFITPSRKGSETKNKKAIEEEEEFSEDEIMPDARETNRLLQETVSSLSTFMDMIKLMMEQQTKMMDQQNKILNTILDMVQTTAKNTSVGQPPLAPCQLSSIEMDFALNQKVKCQQNGESEIETRRLKANNAVIVGMEEANPPVTVTGKDREDAVANSELTLIRSMVKAAGGEETDITAVFRMGQINDDKSRPLKIIGCTAEVKKVLFNKDFREKLIKCGQRPYIRHDQTDLQRRLSRYVSELLVKVRAKFTGEVKNSKFLSNRKFLYSEQKCDFSNEKSPSEKREEEKSRNLLLKEFYQENQICRLILNDPRKRNALSLNLLNALFGELISCNDSRQIRAVIIASSPPIFSAGHDLRELTESEGSEKHRQIFDKCSDVMNAIADIQVPVIAEIRGLAAAAGCQLAASADIVIAAHNASFSVPGAKAGLFCTTPGIALSRAVSRKIAMDMLLTGDSIDAQSALRAGLVSRVVDESRVQEEALNVASKICNLSKPVVSLGKTFFGLQIEMSRRDAYRHGSQVMVENLKLRDSQEGINAFLNKRHPIWKHNNDTVL